MAPPKIGIIILNWNGIKDTLECLTSLHQAKLSNVTTYVIDNHSSQDEASVIAAKHPWTKVITNSQNLGFSGGNNLGIKTALNDRSDYIVLLNNDTTVDPSFIETLATGAQKHGFDIASPKIYFYPAREYHPVPKSQQGKIIWYAGGHMDFANVIATHRGVNEFDHGQYNTPQTTDFATGCCLLISKKVFPKIGYLDETYTAYYEDNDFCHRAKKAGLHVGYIPSSIIWHKNAGSTGGSGSATQNSIIKKSRLRFGLTHAPLRAKLALLRNYYL